MRDLAAIVVTIVGQLTFASLAVMGKAHAELSVDQLNALMPPEQAKLISIIEDARRRYDTGANDLAKGAARPMRAQAICQTFRVLAVRNWVGVVYKLSTNGDGKGVLEVEIGPDVYVHTWNNSLSDYSAKTLIEPTSSVFQSASQLNEHTIVRFSGTFFRSDTDCFSESSMSLAGSIREPEFIFRFTSISQVN